MGRNKWRTAWARVGNDFYTMKKKWRNFSRHFFLLFTLIIELLAVFAERLPACAGFPVGKWNFTSGAALGHAVV